MRQRMCEFFARVVVHQIRFVLVAFEVQINRFRLFTLRYYFSLVTLPHLKHTFRPFEEHFIPAFTNPTIINLPFPGIFL